IGGSISRSFPYHRASFAKARVIAGAGCGADSGATDPSSLRAAGLHLAQDSARELEPGLPRAAPTTQPVTPPLLQRRQNDRILVDRDRGDVTDASLPDLNHGWLPAC